MFTTIIYIFRNSPFITPCTTPHGPTKCISAIVLDTFKLFFTPAIMLTICDQSNLYAKQILSDVAYEKFDQFTIEELYAYFGFMVLMGVNQLPTLSDYWKCDSIYHYSPIADRISRNRFLQISRCLHFTDNTLFSTARTDPTYDRLWKIRPIIDKLTQSCIDLYNPHTWNSIDEAMIPFKGRSMIKQYLPKKPVKRGIKVWVRADAVNGYVSEFRCI